jgi:hypothetical protein
MRILRRRLRTPLAFLGLSILLSIPGAPAFCAGAGPLVITVPPGFDGPIRSDENGGVTIAWVKRRPASDGGTTLQVSAIDVGSSLDNIAPSERIQAASHYLMEFLKGLGARLGHFEFGAFEQVTLAGLPAARVRWTGTVAGHATIGLMYCVLVGHSVVSLQTQDIGSGITPEMYSAIGAIEAVRVR